MPKAVSEGPGGGSSEVFRRPEEVCRRPAVGAGPTAGGCGSLQVYLQRSAGGQRRSAEVYRSRADSGGIAHPEPGRPAGRAACGGSGPPVLHRTRKSTHMPAAAENLSRLHALSTARACAHQACRSSALKHLPRLQLSRAVKTMHA